MFGYALLGAGWLVIKTEGTLQDWARSLGRRCLIGVTLAVAVVSLWTPFIDAHIAARWFSWPNIVLLAPVPLITAGLVWYEWRSLNNRSEYAPFLAALGLFVMSYLGIAISLWPMIVPRHFTLEPGGGVAKHAGLSFDRHARAAAGDFALYGLVILGVSRQGAVGHWISLNFWAICRQSTAEVAHHQETWHEASAAHVLKCFRGGVSIVNFSALARTIVMVVVAMAAAACGQDNRYVAPPPPKVVVAQPVQKPVTLYLNLTGNTAPFSVRESGRARPGLSGIDRL